MPSSGWCPSCTAARDRKRVPPGLCSESTWSAWPSGTSACHSLSSSTPNLMQVSKHRHANTRGHTWATAIHTRTHTPHLAGCLCYVRASVVSLRYRCYIYDLIRTEPRTGLLAIRRHASHAHKHLEGGKRTRPQSECAERVSQGPGTHSCKHTHTHKQFSPALSFSASRRSSGTRTS